MHFALLYFSLSHCVFESELKNADEGDFVFDGQRHQSLYSGVRVAHTREAVWMRREISNLMLVDKQSKEWSPFEGSVCCYA